MTVTTENFKVIEGVRVPVGTTLVVDKSYKGTVDMIGKRNPAFAQRFSMRHLIVLDRGVVFILTADRAFKRRSYNSLCANLACCKSSAVSRYCCETHLVSSLL